MNTLKCIQYGTFTLRDNMYLREKTFLQLIAYSKDQKQKCQLMKCINHDQYFELKKIAINILHGVRPLKKNQLKYLKKSKQFIRKLAEGKTNNSFLTKNYMIVCYIVKIALQYNEKCSETSFSSNRKVGKIRAKKRTCERSFSENSSSAKSITSNESTSEESLTSNESAREESTWSGNSDNIIRSSDISSIISEEEK